MDRTSYSDGESKKAGACVYNAPAIQRVRKSSSRVFGIGSGIQAANRTSISSGAYRSPDGPAWRTKRAWISIASFSRDKSGRCRTGRRNRCDAQQRSGEETSNQINELFHTNTPM